MLGGYSKKNRIMKQICYRQQQKRWTLYMFHFCNTMDGHDLNLKTCDNNDKFALEKGGILGLETDVFRVRDTYGVRMSGGTSRNTEEGLSEGLIF
jgi:hypothetical protein